MLCIQDIIDRKHTVKEVYFRIGRTEAQILSCLYYQDNPMTLSDHAASVFEQSMDALGHTAGRIIMDAKTGDVVVMEVWFPSRTYKKSRNGQVSRIRYEGGMIEPTNKTDFNMKLYTFQCIMKMVTKETYKDARKA